MYNLQQKLQITINSLQTVFLIELSQAEIYVQWNKLHTVFTHSYLFFNLSN
jgi:hypothetical protein